MNEEHKSFKEICIENRAKIMMGTGLIIGAVLGYSIGNRKLAQAKWNFDIIDNTKLVVKITPVGSKTYNKWTFSGRDTKEIVDHLMDELYPGD